MSKQKPRTVGAHVTFRPAKIELKWDRLEAVVGQKLSKKTRAEILEACRRREDRIMAKSGAEARHAQLDTLEKLHKSMVRMLALYREIESTESGRNLLSDFEVELNTAYTVRLARVSTGLAGAMDAASLVQPFLRTIFDAKFAESYSADWESRMADDADPLKKGLVARVAGISRQSATGADKSDDRAFIWALADAIADAEIHVSAVSGSEETARPTTFQRFVFGLDVQMPAHLRIPRLSLSEESFAGWIAKRLNPTKWRRHYKKSRTR